MGFPDTLLKTNQKSDSHASFTLSLFWWVNLAGINRQSINFREYLTGYAFGKAAAHPKGVGVNVGVGRISAVGEGVGVSSSVGVGGGSSVGVNVGSSVGVAVGPSVGVNVGSAVGVGVISGGGVGVGPADLAVNTWPTTIMQSDGEMYRT